MIEKDIAIIGGGLGGYVAAIHAAHLGAKVALIEKGELGGTCLNRGCIPTKTLARAVELLLEARTAKEFGIETGDMNVNFQKLTLHKNEVVGRLRSGVEQLMKGNKISVYRGKGRILSPHSVRVNDEEIAPKKLIVATGSEPARLPIPGTDLTGVLTTDDILELKELPLSLVIIGGSYVGAEFASIFSALGTKVTIVEKLPLCLPTVDEEIAKRFTQQMTKQGIQVKTGAAVKAIEKDGENLKVLWDTPKGEEQAEGQLVLLATGRVPFTEGLGLSEIGVKMNGKAIAVDERLKTSLKDVYAIGDVTGRIMLAHVASYEGEIAVENALGRPRQADYQAVPGCVFTQPELASVGITEEQAKNNNIPYKVSKFPLTASSRAVTMGETTGIVKMLCHAGDGRVLGIHIMGAHASDLIAEGALAMRMGATAQDIAHTIHAHPTLPEALHEAAMGQLDGAIHIQRL